MPMSTRRTIALTISALLLIGAACAVVGVLSELLLWPRPLANAGQLLYRAVFWFTLPGRLVIGRSFPAGSKGLPMGPLIVSAFATPPLLFAVLAGVQRAFAYLRRQRTRKRASGLARRDFLGQGAAGLLIVSGGALGGYTTFVEPGRLRVVHYDVPITRLPPELDGFRIVHLSDTHHGPYITLPYLEGAVARANALEADLAVLTGDYVHRTPRSIPDGIGIFRKLETRLGTVAVTGNHEFWEGIDTCRAAFAETPVHLIDNARVFLTRDGITQSPEARALCMGGVGDLWEDEVRFDKATADAPESMPRLVLAHNPDTAEHVPPRLRVDLMLCGHTHGGQVCFPRIGTPSVPSRYGSKYAGGLCQGPQCRVLVSRGVGMAILPVRFRVRPEIGLITLRRTQQAIARDMPCRVIAAPDPRAEESA